MTASQYYLRCEAGHSIPLGVAHAGADQHDVSEYRCLCGAPVELVRNPVRVPLGIRPDEEAWEAEEDY